MLSLPAAFSRRSEAQRTEAYAFVSSLAAALLTVFLSILLKVLSP